MFLIYLITFSNAHREVWLYPEDADPDTTAREVQELIDRRNAIPDALQITKTERMVGTVYHKRGQYGPVREHEQQIV